MDAAVIRGLKPKLLKYLQEYGDCFGRSDTRGHLATYVEGQLSKLDRKSVEPIAGRSIKRNSPQVESTKNGREGVLLIISRQ